MHNPSLSQRARPFLTRIGAPVALLLVATGSWAAWAGGAATADAGIDWAKLLMGLFGGLALFLYGMELMSDALKRVAGDRMKSILAALSNNRVMGLVTGAIVTAVVQSSSVTTVMLVGFVSASLMSFGQTIGIILGAGIGTTITAQIVAFKVTKYALLLVSLGFGVAFTARREKPKQYGLMVLGLGLIFFGMAVMSEAMYPLREFPPFVQAMAHMDNPVAGILASTLFTALVQSSSATLGVIIVLAMQGLITLDAGIALALGANIGTCATAALAAIGKPREAVRVAAAHVSFKIVGVLLFLPFIPEFADLVREISPSAAAGQEGVERLAQEVPRQVANAHSLFAVVVALVFLPLTGPFGRLIHWLVPDRKENADDTPIVESRYLDSILLGTPGMAIDAARKELARAGRRVAEMLGESLEEVLHGDTEGLDRIQQRDEEVDVLYGHIVTFLGQISRQELTEQQTGELMELMTAANELETIGDVIETDLVGLGHRRLLDDVQVSAQTEALLSSLHGVVCYALDAAIDSVTNLDNKRARGVLKLKPEVNRLVGVVERHQVGRLVADEPGRLEAYSLELDVLDRLKRIYYHCKRMAKTVRRTDAA